MLTQLTGAVLCTPIETEPDTVAPPFGETIRSSAVELGVGLGVGVAVTVGRGVEVGVTVGRGAGVSPGVGVAVFGGVTLLATVITLEEDPTWT
jgi:hypothetical protein